jgi:isopenicillin N synthase-like dioxygenase
MTENPTGATRISIEALPVIDISGWYHGSEAERDAVARTLFETCRDVGFFYVCGHGLPEHLVVEAFDGARAFFALPDEQKAKIHYRHGGYRRGYVPMLEESSDPTGSGDLKEAFDFGCDPVGRDPWPGIEGGAVRNLWPEVLPDLRLVVEALRDALRDLASTLFAMLAQAMGSPPTLFAEKIDRPVATMRLLRYPPQSVAANDTTIGIGEHCDYECLTILIQDKVGGLQVKGLDGRWIEAPPLDGAFVVNVGEMLTRWSGGLLPSTAHRVVNVNSVERYSIPLFFATNPDVVIEPLWPVEDRSAYPPIAAGDYLAHRLGEIYPNQSPTSVPAE